VGLAADFLEKKNIFTDTELYKKAVYDFVVNFESKQEFLKSNTEIQYRNCISKCDYHILDSKLEKVYNFILEHTP
jgi:hypothetical protein